MAERIETVARVDGLRIHRFQVVREHRGRSDEDGVGGEGRDEWIVVGFVDDDGSDRAVVLADPAFERTRQVSGDAFESGRFETLSAGGVPVWGY